MNISKKGISTTIIILSVAAIIASLNYVIVEKRSPGSGTVIILNGTSSAGKTSVINELKKTYAKAYEAVAMDTFRLSYEDSHPIPKELESVEIDKKAKEQLRKEWDKKRRESFYVFIRDRALNGHNILVDEVFYPETYEEITKILENIKTIKVLLYCPLDVTVSRVEQRNLIPEEYRYIVLPISQYPMLYKSQEADSEKVLDKVSSKYMKKFARSTIDSFTKSLPENLKNMADVVIKDCEDIYKNFVQEFKLDELEEVEIVSKKPYDLILDCRQTPIEIAKEIEHFVETRN